jgi:tripeptide aminopeptidase
MNVPIDQILQSLPQFEEKLRSLREMILANLVMVGEIPAPTFEEKTRVQFVRDRFSECGLHTCSTDEKGNVFGVIPGQAGKKNILVVAHVDTLFSNQIDHTISVDSDRVIGPGVGDNSLGVASITSLPTILEHLDIQLQSNLVLMGSVKGLGRGDLEGLRFFLKNNTMPISAGVCVEGAEIGRLSYESLGMIRGEISCAVPEAYDWTQFGASGAILTLHDVIDKINKIPTPRRPFTAILLSSIHAGGDSYNRIATRSILRFEVRSESAEIVENIENQLHDIIEEKVLQSGADIKLDIFARRKPGGISYSHPLIDTIRKIMQKLNIQTWITPSISELSAFIDHQIPAVTIGISKDEVEDDITEQVQIEPMFTGLSQLVGLLLAIDNGVCDEKS